MTRLRSALLISLLALTAFAGPASPALAGTLPPIRHVFVIMLENKTYAETFGANSAAPYLSRTLPSEGALVPNYYGVTHESLGNYIALISGQGSNPATQIDCVVTYSDVFPGLIGPDGQALGAGCAYPKSVTTVAGQLNAGGLSWKGYMEDMGRACRHPALGSRDPNITATVGDQYATRHNPFVYFHSIIDTPACARDDVPLAQLPADLTSASTTPNLAFITPNLCHDGHDSPCVDGQPGGLRSVNAFLTTWVPRILHSPAYRAGGLLAILFDEADGNDATACCNEPKFPNTVTNGGLVPGPGGGRTGAVFISPFIDPGTTDATAYNHFSVLRTVEDVFGLGHLGYAGTYGLQSAGPDLFTCFRSAPVPRRGRLPSGSMIKRTAGVVAPGNRRAIQVELWHPGRLTVTIRRLNGRGRPFGRTRTLTGDRAVGQCASTTVAVPSRREMITLVARAFGGAERDTIRFG